MRFVFACVCASEQPRWSNSYGISPRDSTGGGSMLSPTGSVGSVGSASGWGGSGSMISPTLNGSISGGAGSSLTSPVPTPSTSPKEKPKVCQACGCVLASHSPTHHLLLLHWPFQNSESQCAIHAWCVCHARYDTCTDVTCDACIYIHINVIYTRRRRWSRTVTQSSVGSSLP